MTNHTETLIHLGTELLRADKWRTLYRISASIPFERSALIEFDDTLWGPSLSRIANNGPNAPGTLGIPRHGITRCEIEDRAIFKPLHYCMVSLTDPDQDLEWEARSVVEMSSAHLEHLVGRIGRLTMLPLGNVLRKTIVRQKIDPVTWDQLWRYRGIYNAAKHQFDHALGTHLFSVQDAVIAYEVSRRLGQELHHQASLKTDPRFERDPSPYY